ARHHARGITPDRQQRHEIADSTGQLDRRWSVAGVEQPDASVHRDDTDVDAAEFREQQQGEIREGMIETWAAERTEHDDGARSPFEGRPKRHLGIRFVLVDRRPVDRNALRLERSDAVLAKGVAVADPPVDPQLEVTGVTSAAVSRNDVGVRQTPARPGCVEGGPRPGRSVREDDGLLDHVRRSSSMRRMLAVAPVADARLPPCPTRSIILPFAVSWPQPSGRASTSTW